VGNHVRNMILSGPLFFLGGVMLTEPATMPPTRYYRYLFALLTAVLFAGQLHLGSFYISPELSLVLANILAFSVGLRQRVTLTLVEARQMSTNVYDFVFKPSSRFMFKPGQYLEWTLALPHVDGRGNRRTFTIASSPTEELVHLGVKFYEPSSAFKTMLHSMKPGEKIHTGQLAGDFTMPADHRKKLVWIAGGIGITPFRAQAQYLIDARQTRDITLLYFVSKPEERSYAEVFEAARAVGVKTVYVLSTKDAPANWRGKQGALTPELLKQEVPDFASRTFYISGPPAMVRGYKQLLTSVGVQRKNIKTDYFSGY